VGSIDTASGDEENFSRIGILHFLAGSVSGHIDIAAARIERAEDVTGLAGNLLGGGKL